MMVIIIVVLISFVTSLIVDTTYVHLSLIW